MPVLAYLPASVIAGFLILPPGPQVLGALTGGWSLVPAEATEVMARLPGIMINIVRGIMIGKSLPSVRQIWSTRRPTSSSAASSLRVPRSALAVVFILTPFFGLPDVAY